MANKEFRIKHGLNVAEGKLVVDAGVVSIEEALSVGDKLTVDSNGADIVGLLTAKNNAQVDGNLTISGDLTVSGTTVNTANLIVEDAIIKLAKNNSSGSISHIGIQAERGDIDAYWLWEESIDRWRAGTSPDGITYTDSNIQAGTFYGNLVGNVSGQASDISNFDTGDLSEGSNLYFTDARATNAISVNDAGGDGSLVYDNSTGIITYTGSNAAEHRAHFSATAPIVYTSATGVISLSADTDDITEAGNLYYTNARVQANKLNEMAAPTEAISMNNQKITGVADGVNPSDAVNKNQLDAIEILTTLTDLTDTVILTPADAHLMVYDDLADKWKNKVLTGDITMTKAGVTSIGATKVTNGMLVNDSLTIVTGGALTGGQAIALGGTASLGIGVDGSSIEIDSNALRIKALGVTNAMLSGDIASTKLAELDNFDTGDLSEGSNLYYTDAKVRANRLDQLTAPSSDVSINGKKLTNVADGVGSSDAVNKSQLDAAVGVTSLPALTDVSNNLDTGLAQHMVFKRGASQWEASLIANDNIASDAAIASSKIENLSSFTADNLVEASSGPTNIYFTTARARSSVSGSSPIGYNLSTGVISWGGDTDDVPEGSKLYYTDTRVRLNRLDQMTAPIANLSLNSKKIINLDPGADATDAINKSQLDGHNHTGTYSPIDHAHAISNLTDVDTATTTPTAGQALIWDSPNWEPGTIHNGEWGETSTVLHPRIAPTTQDVVVGGTSTTDSDIVLKSDGSAVFNEQGSDVDFRVESSTNENSLFVKGGDGNIGIGTDTPSGQLSVGTIEKNLSIHTVSLTNGRQTHPTTGTTTTCNEETYIMHQICSANSSGATLSIGGGLHNTPQSPGSFKTIELGVGEAMIFEVDLFTINTGDPLATGAWKLSGFAVRSLSYSDTGAQITAVGGNHYFTVQATGHNLTEANVVAISWDDSAFLSAIGDGEFSVTSVTTNSFTCSTGEWTIPGSGSVTIYEDWFADGVLVFPATITKDILNKDSHSNGTPKIEINVSSAQVAGSYGNFYITFTKVNDIGNTLTNGDGLETKACCIARIVRMSS